MHRTVRTPDDGILCAAFAIVSSLRLQRPDIQITDDGIQEILHSDEFQSRLTEFQFAVPAHVNDDIIENLKPGLTT